MKKLFALLLAGILCACAVACNSDKSDPPKDTQAATDAATNAATGAVTEPEETGTSPQETTLQPEETTLQPEDITLPESEITEPTILVRNTTAAAGSTVDVTVDIKNNPGVAGARLYIAQDTKLTLKSATVGDAFSALDYTPPYELSNPCPFNWDSLDAVANTDGTILILTFEVAADATAGEQLSVSVSYSQGDLYDYDLNDLTPATVGGAITIK
jgi:hypothetical protein